MFPSPELAIEMLDSVVTPGPWTATRFPTGLAHFVFDAESSRGERFVVRISRREQVAVAANSVRLARLLRPLGVPLPSVVHADFSLARFSFPFVILERLPGSDLGDVYLELDQSQKQAIAAEMVRISEIVGGLPAGNGFGFAMTPDSSALKPTWRGVLDDLIDRAQERFLAPDRDLFALSVRVRGALEGHSDVLANVKPKPFLHDTTTKNVIVHEGRLSGIVDIDDFCFGDRLFTPALTWASLIARGWPTDYVEHFWSQALHLDRNENRLLRLYAAAFCVDLLGELGQTFGDKHVPANPEARRRLLTTGAQLLD